MMKIFTLSYFSRLEQRGISWRDISIGIEPLKKVRFPLKNQNCFQIEEGRKR